MDKGTRAEACNNFIQDHYQKVATMEFSRDRKSMSVICDVVEGASGKSKKNKRASGSSTTVMFIKGAPEAVLERCNYLRVASDPESCIKLTPNLRQRIMDTIYDYGTSKSLRCLALATIDKPISIDEFNLKDPKNYVKYEVFLISLICCEH